MQGWKTSKECNLHYVDTLQSALSRRQCDQKPQCCYRACNCSPEEAPRLAVLINLLQEVLKKTHVHHCQTVPVKTDNKNTMAIHGNNTEQEHTMAFHNMYFLLSTLSCMIEGCKEVKKKNGDVHQSCLPIRISEI